MSRILPLLCLSLFACPSTKAPPEPAPTEATAGFTLPADDAPIPSDPAVRIGTLDNGLTYYIEPNDYPKDRAELRLVVRAGSVQEDPDQLGLAHLVEHMAFNGSENFEGNDLIAYMESLGAEFGPHVNAYTSFDRTVYMLFVPTDDQEALDTGLTVLRDWAGGVSFVTEEIEKERGVVLEEWRRRQGVGSRIQDQLLPLTFHDSLYAERLPIGTEESLKGFEPDAVRRFYQDWYRPELMAVVVVGAVDVDAMEQEIQARFGDLTNPEDARPMEIVPVPDHAEMLVAVATDPEVTWSAVNYGAKIDAPQGATHGWMKTHLAEQMVGAALNERFADLAQAPDAPFLGAGGGRSPLNAERAMVAVGGRAKEGQELETLEVLLTELERMERFGVTQAELDRAKAQTRSSYERMYKEREATHSRAHADEIVRVFTTGEFMCGIEYERDMVLAVLDGLSLEDVNVEAAKGLPTQSRVLTLVMPEKEGLAVPTEQALRDLVAEVEARDIAPPEGEAAELPLMATLPEPGSVTERARIEALDLTVLTLSNGATVMYKQTDFKADEVLFSAWSPGGRSLAGQEGEIPAATAVSIADRSGLGEMNMRALQKALAGRQASAGVGISTYWETLGGGGSPEELELMLQLTHLRFTAPRFDAEAFELVKEGRAESLRNRDANPDVRFNDAVTQLEWQDHWYFQPWSLDDLDAMDLDASKEFYEARFNDASEWTFLFVGNLDAETFEPLVARYIASLPSLNDGAEEWVDFGYRRVEGEQELIMGAGKEPKASVRIRYHGPVEDDRLLRNQLQGLAELLDTLLTEELREARGGVYSVGVNAGISDLPVPWYTATISFTCDPERVDELRAATEEVIASLQAEPVDEAYIQRVIETRRRERETELRTNSFWLGGIRGSLQRGEDPVELLTWDERNESLTPEIATALAKAYLSGPNVIVTVMMPEE